MSESSMEDSAELTVSKRPDQKTDYVSHNAANAADTEAHFRQKVVAMPATATADSKLRADFQTQFDGHGGDSMAQVSPNGSMPSLNSLVCRICHNGETPEQLVSPCDCKGTMTYVHLHCLERWICTSRCTTCELCHFRYNTEQTLRYTCCESLRLWYARAMSRRALQEDCQMFSLLTLVAFGIIGTLVVGLQYYSLHTETWGISKIWTRSWLLFFLVMTASVYAANVYMLVRAQLMPWFRWWQSARDIKLILENHRPFRITGKLPDNESVQVQAALFEEAVAAAVPQPDEAVELQHAALSRVVIA